MSNYFIWIAAIAIVSLLMNVIQYWIVCQVQGECDELNFTLTMRQAEAGIMNERNVALNNAVIEAQRILAKWSQSKNVLITRHKGFDRIDIFPHTGPRNVRVPKQPYGDFAEMMDDINRNRT